MTVAQVVKHTDVVNNNQETRMKYASFAAKDMREAGSLWEGIGTISAFQFTNEAPDNYTIEGNPGSLPLFAKVSIVADGEGAAEERTQTQQYSLGQKASEEFTISPDGYGLVPINAEISSGRKGTKFDIFVRSLETEGLPATVLADGDFSKLVGLKANFKRVNDPERSFNNDRKQKESKFKPQTLVAVKILALPGEKGAATTTATASSNAPAGATVVPEGDLDTVTGQYLQDVLAKAKDKRVQRSQLTLALNKAAMEHPQRTDIARRGADEAFLASLAELGIVVYDPSAKPQYVTLAS